MGADLRFALAILGWVTLVIIYAALGSAVYGCTEQAQAGWACEHGYSHWSYEADCVPEQEQEDYNIANWAYPAGTVGVPRQVDGWTVVGGGQAFCMLAGGGVICR